MASDRRKLFSAILFTFSGIFITLSTLHIRDQTTKVSYSIGPLVCCETIESPVNLTVNCDRWNLLSDVVKNCIATKLVSLKPGELWSNLNPIVETCGYLVQQLLDTQFLPNKDDLKGFIDYVDNSNGSDCNLVTIGIGGDILSEVKLLEMLPNCRLYGSDPMNASGQIYSKIGKYYHIAISDKTEQKLAIVLKNPDNIVDYSVANVSHVGLTEFLMSYANVSVVDFLFLDAEGSEYRLLPLFSHGGELERLKISICQMSVEIHGPLADFGISKDNWELLVKNFLLNSNFIPLWTGIPWNHHRMFLINYADKICFDKFFSIQC